ncbi:MAG: LLM class flavin-dependent oxidoreductase [Candidatus Limnocylindrales bacterium]
MRVGLVMPLGDDGTGRIPAYGEVRALARQAEEAGFDSIWVFDHLFFRTAGGVAEGINEGWTVLAGLADATEGVGLGTLVLCTAFRNPALIAKQAATLDEMSGGRLTLGLGTGWHEPEFRAFGYPFDHRASRFAEAFAIIRGLLRDGRVDFHGRFHEASGCELLPRPVRADLPLLVAARGARMLRLAAREADAWNAAWFGLPDERLAARVADLRAACHEVGRDPATIERTVGLTIRFPDLLPAGAPPGTSAALGGTGADLAAGLRAHAEAGASEVICSLDPATPAALDRLAAGLRDYRAAA